LTWFDVGELIWNFTAISQPAGIFLSFPFAASSNSLAAYTELEGTTAIAMSFPVVAKTMVDFCPKGSSADGHLAVTADGDFPVWSNPVGSSFLDLSQTDYSWCIWVYKGQNNPAVGHAQALWTLGDEVTMTSSSISAGFLNTANDRFYIIHNGNDSPISGSTEYSDTGSWVLWCGSFTYGTPSVTVLRNNVLVGTSAFVALDSPTAGKLTIGDRDVSMDASEHHMRGSFFDEFRLWSRVLSPSEFTQGYTAGLWTDYKMQIHLAFSVAATSGTTVFDYSGHGRHFTASTLQYADATVPSVCRTALFAHPGLPAQLLPGQEVSLMFYPNQDVAVDVALKIQVYNAKSEVKGTPFKSQMLNFVHNTRPALMFSFTVPASGDIFMFFSMADAGAYLFTPPDPISAVISPISGLCMHDDGHLATTNSPLLTPADYGIVQDFSSEQSLYGKGFTLSLWVKVNNFTGQTRTALMIGGDGLLASRYVTLSLDSFNHPMFTHVGFPLVGTEAVVQPHVWVLLTGVFTNNNRRRDLYMNSTLLTSDVGIVNDPYLGFKVVLGAVCDGSTTCVQPWNGAIDEVRVWSRELSSAEISQLFLHNYVSKSPGDLFALELYFPFSEHGGTQIGDISTRSPTRQMTLKNYGDSLSTASAPFVWEIGSPLCTRFNETISMCPVGYTDDGSIVFNGQATYGPLIRTKIGADLRAGSLASSLFKDITISFWTRRTTLPATVSTVLQIALSTHPTSPPPGNYLRIGFDGASQYKIFLDIPGNPRLEGVSEVQTGVWVQYTFSVRMLHLHPADNGGRQRVYRNGVWINSQIGTVDLNPNTLDVQLNVGGAAGLTTAELFEGRVDELIIFNEELDPSVIYTAYTTRSWLSQMAYASHYYPFSEKPTSNFRHQDYADGSYVSASSLSGKSTANPRPADEPLCLSNSISITNLRVGSVEVSGSPNNGRVRPTTPSVTVRVHPWRATSSPQGYGVQCFAVGRDTNAVIGSGKVVFTGGVSEADTFKVSGSAYPWRNLATFHVSVTWAKLITIPITNVTQNATISCRELTVTLPTSAPIPFEIANFPALPVYVQPLERPDATSNYFVVHRAQRFFLSRYCPTSVTQTDLIFYLNGTYQSAYRVTVPNNSPAASAAAGYPLGVVTLGNLSVLAKASLTGVSLVLNADYAIATSTSMHDSEVHALVVV
jgi:hypothetical protein